MRGQMLRDDEPARGWAGLSTARRVQLVTYAAATLAALGMALVSYGAKGADVPDHDWIGKATGYACCTPAQHCFPIETDQVTRHAKGATVRWTLRQAPWAETVAPDQLDIERVTEVPATKIMPSEDPQGRVFFCSPGCLFEAPEV